MKRIVIKERPDTANCYKLNRLPNMPLDMWTRIVPRFCGSVTGIEAKIVPTKLNERQRRFANEFLVDLNGTQAAIRAGYSADSARESAAENLARPAVRQLVDKTLTARAEKTQIQAERVLLETARMALVDIGQAFDENGVLLPLCDMPEDVRRSISYIEVEELWEGKGEDRVQIGVLKRVKFWDKPKAVELLGKHLRLFSDRVEVAVESISDEDRAARLVELIERGRSRTITVEGIRPAEDAQTGFLATPRT